MASKLYQRIFFISLFVAIIVLSYYITKPFIISFFTGAIFAYLSHPLYERILKKVKNRNLSAMIVTTIIILLISVPFTLIVGLVAKEASSAYDRLQESTDGGFIEKVCREPGFICKTISEALPDGDANRYLKIIIENIIDFVKANAKDFLTSLPSIAMNFFVMLFVIYYLLKDGPSFARKLTSILPLKDHHKREIVKRFHNVTSEVFYANIFVSILQGAIGTLGFIVLGVPSPLLWGSVMTVFAFIPYFGTAIIWVPASLNLIFQGQIYNDTSMFVRGIILLFYGILVISSIDNIVKPKLIGKNANIHPVVVLLGVLGGLRLFGFIGLILGPLMLAILVTFIDIYEKEKEELGGGA